MEQTIPYAHKGRLLAGGIHVALLPSDGTTLSSIDHYSGSLLTMQSSDLQSCDYQICLVI